MPAHPVTSPELRLARSGPSSALDLGEGRARPLRIAGHILFWPALLKAGLLTGGALTAFIQYLVELG